MHKVQVIGRIAIQWLFLFLLGWGIISWLSLDTRLSLQGLGSGKTRKNPKQNFSRALKIDHRSLPSDIEEIEEIAKNLPNLPILFLYKHRSLLHTFEKNQSCARIVNQYKVRFDSTYWQTLRSSAGVFYLYSSYYDSREMSPLGPSVRILALVNRASINVTTYCQFWFDPEDKPVIVKYNDYKHVWSESWGGYKIDILQPFLVTCHVPEEMKSKVPTAVSLVEKECQRATNILKVIYNVPEVKENFAVCVKGRYLTEDTSPRLIEWMELLDLLGVNKTFFYSFKTHPNIKRVIDHYVELGKAEYTTITMPGGKPDLPILHQYYLSKNPHQQFINEIILYNDCLYKNLYSYKYIIFLDVDEVVVPVKDANWETLLDSVRLSADESDEDYAAYNVRHFYYLDRFQPAFSWDIPDFMHILQHVYRTRHSTPPAAYSKSFYDTSRVVSLSDQYPIHVFDEVKKTFAVSDTSANVHSYRTECIGRLKEDCQAISEIPMKDSIIWKFKDDLIERTIKTLNLFGYF